MNAQRHFTSLLCLLLLCPFFLQAQSNYKPGYVVTTAGDTLQGFINYKEWVLSPTSFSFKNSATEAAVTDHDVSNTTYFEINGIEAYQRYEGPITTNATDLQHLTYNSAFEVTSAVVFLKILEKGENVKLLAYTDMLKTRYFVQEQHQAAPQELYYNLYFNRERKVVAQKGYVGQLQHLATTYEVKSPRLEREIEKANYKDYALITIVKQLNKPESAPAAAPYKPQNYRFFAGIRLNSHVANVVGDHKLSKADKTSANVAPQVVAGADVFVNPHVQKLLIRLELAAGTASYAIERTERSGSGVTEHTYSLGHKSVSISPQVIYNLYNKDNLKGFIGIGGHLHYSKVSDNVYRSQYHNPTIPIDYAPTIRDDHFATHPLWVSVSVRGGVAVGRKLELLAAYMPPSTVASTNFYNLSLSSYTLGINYFLNKR